MFEDQNQQNAPQSGAPQGDTPVEDIFSDTEQPSAQQAVPAGAAIPRAPQPGPPSALSQGKLKTAGAQSGAASEQVSKGSSGFPIGRAIAIGGVSIVVIALVIGGVFWIQNRSNTQVESPNLGIPDSSTVPASQQTTEPPATTDTTVDAPDTTQDNTPPSGTGSILDSINNNARDRVLDPFAQEPAAPKDTDQDGLTDDEEIALGTNPRLVDSDSDGLSDWEEVSVFGTDPLAQDTDGDTYSDGEEVQNGYNPNGEGKLLNFGDAN